MKYNPDIHRRRSIRLKGYDYSSEGMYYITLCVNQRLCLLGEIEDGEMILNDAGKMVDRIWKEIPKYYTGVGIDEYIVMPNHFHGIIILNNDDVGAPPRGRPLTNPENRQIHQTRQTQVTANRQYRQVQEKYGKERMKYGEERIEEGQARGPAPTNACGRLSLGDVIGRFESFTMYQYILGVRNHQWTPFYKKLWQRNYYEHIIRDENELNKIRQYIISNPLKWEFDKENPKNWSKNQ